LPILRLIYPPEAGEWRFVFHHPYTADDTRHAVEALKASL